MSPAQASSCSAFCRVGLKYYKMMETLIGGFEETINSVHCEVRVSNAGEEITLL
jgi:hypothetical protein